MQFLQNSTVKIAEALTGILVSEKNDWKLSVGKLVQATLKSKLLNQLGQEIKEYTEKGKIKEDYFATHKEQATLYELLKFLDENVPDEELFKALKSIFFSGISSTAEVEDQMLSYEFLNTAKKLNGTEILILKANFEIVNGKIKDGVSDEILKNAQSNRDAWTNIIARQMGYGDLRSVVAKYELNLENLSLISPRAAVTNYQIEFRPTKMYRLTDAGIKFCEFITRFDTN